MKHLFLLASLAAFLICANFCFSAEVKLTWDDSGSADQGNLAEYWIVYFGLVDAEGNPVQGGEAKSVDGPVITSPYQVSEKELILVPSIGQWGFAVQACNEIGCSELSSYVYATVTEEANDPETPPSASGFSGEVTYVYDNGLLINIITKEQLE